MHIENQASFLLLFVSIVFDICEQTSEQSKISG